MQYAGVQSQDNKNCVTVRILTNYTVWSNFVFLLLDL
uniref:Uncharacterized protein n=1 Tax=Anguilla anguilla TaxID=7936 RepID=A0A0E9QUS5_ANGAN